MADVKKPVALKIDWDKNDGWSKTEQVGYNQAVIDYEDYIASKLEMVEKVIQPLVWNSRYFSDTGQRGAKQISTAIKELFKGE